MPRAVWNATVIADSDDVEVVDAYTYFPVDAVKQQYGPPVVAGRSRRLEESSSEDPDQLLDRRGPARARIAGV